MQHSQYEKPTWCTNFGYAVCVYLLGGEGYRIRTCVSVRVSSFGVSINLAMDQRESELIAVQP